MAFSFQQGAMGAIGDPPMRAFDPSEYSNTRPFDAVEYAARQSLTVHDAERLARAGVKIDLEHVNITEDPRNKDWVEKDPWAIAVEDRLRMNPMFGMRLATRELHLRLMGGKYGEKVFICVHLGNRPPVLLDDDAHLFPSDALMAKIHLLDKQPSSPDGSFV